MGGGILDDIPEAPLPQSAPALPGAHGIFDLAGFLPMIDTILAPLADAATTRRKTVEILTAARNEAMADITAGFASHPRSARETVRAIAELTDSMICVLFHVAAKWLHPLGAPSGAQHLTIIAVGGYGRAEMAPQSDVDLLFLTPWKPTGWAESMIESILYMLWDLKLKIGHATRSIDEALRLAGSDTTIRTSMIEHRLVAGDAGLAEELRGRLHSELFDSSVPEFIEAKLEERSQRHEKQGGQRYVLEPNVKEGKGGLRDLQTLYWIAKYIHHVDRAAELVPLGVFTQEEHLAFWQAEDFLWAVRCHLHLITRRPVERLTFDIQPEIADRMGYRDMRGRRAVEMFMQDYFRHATRVGEITRVFLTDLEARHLRSPPMLERIFRRRPALPPQFANDNGRLTIADEATFFDDPVNILRLFNESLDSGLLIHPRAMRLVHARLDLITPSVCADPVAAEIFLDMLLKQKNPERALRHMNELGVLGAYIPEFHRIVAMMQFNVYHHYTVDEHSLQCITALAEIERGLLDRDLPLATSIMQGDINRRIIFLAVLLHDIGKGRPEDHSIIGAHLARRVCLRLRLPVEEVETVEWLVRNHLLMSDIAQKRDISDPRTLRDFAKAVKTRKRLDLLLILTVCDIRGVGPDTWNNWKAMLLRRLHTEAALALESGMEELNRDRRSDEAKRKLAEALAAQGWAATDIEAETARHYNAYWAALQTDTHAVFAKLLKDISDNEIRIDLHPDEDRDATRAAFALADHPGIFSRLAGALTLVGANVVDARTYTSRDGYATPVFWVQDDTGHPYSSDRLPKLREMINDSLEEKIIPQNVFATRDKPHRRESAFRFPTHITFDNEGSDIHTIIEIDTRDRPGLLYDLTRTFAENNIQIVSAQIATFGAQVVDSFYVKDLFGLKIQQSERQEALERKLRDAIRQGAERAAS